jgi:PPOX class probable FMN-dependent enzyme
MTATLTRPETTYTTITSADELRALLGQPSERAVLKVRPELDVHCRTFIARSNMLMLATADRDGRLDVSPRGDPPGFVQVLDDVTLLIPERAGNKRGDSLLNIVENPHVGTIFLIPGVDETLRVNGRARLVTDRSLLEPLALEGKTPQLGILVHVEEAFLPCARSFLRARLWDPARYLAEGEMPTLAQMIMDQIRPPGRSDEEHARLVADVRRQHLDHYCHLY